MPKFHQTITDRGVVTFVLTSAFFCSTTLPVYAWGTRAHRIVAHIATAHLSTSARQEVMRLIKPDSLADISDDADRWREVRPETSPWHYVNIPFAESAYDPSRDCPRSDCIIAAITKFRTVLTNPQYRDARRKEALIFLVHLIADAHQPLHCIDNSDRGGNDVTVTFFGIATNLHAVWDTELLSRTRLGERAYTHRLSAWLALHDIATLQQGTPVDWVLEAHAFAQQYAYGLPKDGSLRSGYYRRNLPIVESQLAKAGVRLARVLNDLFPDLTSTTPPVIVLEKASRSQ